MNSNQTVKPDTELSPDPDAIGTSLFHTRNDPFQKIEIVWISVAAIKDAPRRTRKALNAQIAAVTRSIERYGNRIPILVGGREVGGRHTVIDGHARLAAARLLGATEIPCIVVSDLPESDIRRLALSLNKLQQYIEWEATELRIEIGELIDLDGDYEIPGFEIAELGSRPIDFRVLA